MAFDPSVSAAQHRAMAAAAHGHSTLKIPASVGKEFLDADKGKSFDAAPVKGAGIMLVTPDGRALFTKRGKDAPNGGTWDFPGGHVDGEETPEAAATRETLEDKKDVIARLSAQITGAAILATTSQGILPSAIHPSCAGFRLGVPLEHLKSVRLVFPAGMPTSQKEKIIEFFRENGIAFGSNAG